MPAETLLTVPTFKIKVDGIELSADTLAAVESVRFEEEINTASMFVLKLSTYDFEKCTLKFIDLEQFSMGREVKLYMGMDDEVLMTVGEITSLEPLFGENMSVIEVRGYDRLHRLRFGTKRRTFSDMKDSDIASMIAGDWGLSANVTNTGITYPHVYQNNQSDLGFLLERARRIRYEVYVDDRTLYFRSGKEGDSASITLEYKVDLIEFSAKLSARYRGTEITVQGWDFMKKEPISATARKGDEISKMAAEKTGTELTESAFGKSSSAVVNEYLLDATDAEKIAVATYNAHIVKSVTGNGRCTGIPELRAGRTVEIAGLGRFSGSYYVTSTFHTIDNTGYTTSFNVRRTGV